MNDVLLVGPPCSGKHELCDILTNFIEADVVNVGECIRKKYEHWCLPLPAKVSCDDLADIIRENIRFGESNIIINAFEDPCQASRVLEFYEESLRPFRIIWIEDYRTHAPMPPVEQSTNWDRFGTELWELLSTKYKDFLSVVENTDEGFVFKKVS